MGLLPIIITAATVTTVALDGGGIENGEWNGVSVRDKNPKNNRGPGDYFSTGSKDLSAELNTWLNANPGGGKTDFTYRRPKELVPPPAGSEDLGDSELIKLTAVLGVTSTAVLLTKTGVLGGGAGLLAKFMLDTWDGIAVTVLPGAILKY